MSRPPKLTKLKPEENQPLFEAYVTDLIITPAMSTPTSVENLTVMPANNNEEETGVTSAPAQCKLKKEQNKTTSQTPVYRRARRGVSSQEASKQQKSDN